MVAMRSRELESQTTQVRGRMERDSEQRREKREELQSCCKSGECDVAIVAPTFTIVYLPRLQFRAAQKATEATRLPIQAHSAPTARPYSPNLFHFFPHPVSFLALLSPMPFITSVTNLPSQRR